MPKKSVEETYQKLNQLEHVLLRPDTYVGSVEVQDQLLWTESNGEFKQKTVAFCPALYKIFDEILSNAADNKVRDSTMTTIKVTIDVESSSISVWNDGKGIPVQIHKKEGVYVPELIFGNLLTSSNYNDNEKKITGGRNGYGAKLCNIFSKKFIVETSSIEDGKKFKQIFQNNMNKKGTPNIKNNDAKDYTKITFVPDLSRFGLEEISQDMANVLSKRVYDIAGTTRGVKVYLNGKQVKVKSFQDYVKLYIKAGQRDSVEEDEPKKVTIAYEKNERWEVCCVPSLDGQFHSVSFVNSICTVKGGTHVTHVVDQIVSKIGDLVKKQTKEKLIRPANIKGQLWVFVNSLIENPSFDSQSKEVLNLKASNFGSSISIGDTFIKNLLKSDIMENLLSLVKTKEAAQLKKTDGSKKNRITGISKLDDANLAGTKQGKDCTLILTEGDSAKALAVSGLAIVGRDKWGVFPLRGKPLNVREASSTQLLKNEEINNIKRILGLQHQKKYTSVDSLRYGHVMIMADQDHDGSHIKGLILNLFDHFWPSLLKLPGFVLQFITPIVRATRGAREVIFYTIPEYEAWKEENPDGWTIKYYKGLGTSTSADAKKYFQDMARHVRPFAPCGDEARQSLQLAFSKKKADDRKEWLRNYDPEAHMDTNIPRIPIEDFVNKELIVHSMADNVRSINSCIDGLKPGHRKILFSCIKRNLTKGELKVAQLAGYVSEHSAYHHGENSLQQTIINLAFTHVGSNNINLLEPIGQFGTRIQGGKDHAAPRYIFTRLTPLARKIYNPLDDALLKYQNDDGISIEPEWYIPILPMVLVNGSEGIGTGWSTSVFNHNPIDIVDNLIRKLDGGEFTEMNPWYRGFTGTIEKAGTKYTITGVYNIKNDTTLEITELPIGTWTQSYKEYLEELLQGTEKSPPFIKDFKEYHTDTTVKFVITLAKETLDTLQAEPNGIIKKFKLVTTKTSSNLVLFDDQHSLKKYDTVSSIMELFYRVRFDYYVKRKAWQEKTLAEELEKLDNKVRFLSDVISGDLVVHNKGKEELVNLLASRNFKEITKDYDYLLSMPLWSLTNERMEKIIKERDDKRIELEIIKEKTPTDLWKFDLEDFRVEWQKELDADSESVSKAKESVAKKGKGLKLSSSAKRSKRVDDSDDDFQERVEVKPLIKKAKIGVLDSWLTKKSTLGDTSQTPKEPSTKAAPKIVKKSTIDTDSSDSSEPIASTTTTTQTSASTSRKSSVSSKRKSSSKIIESDSNEEFELDSNLSGNESSNGGRKSRPSRRSNISKSYVIDHDDDDDDGDVVMVQDAKERSASISEDVVSAKSSSASSSSKDSINKKPPPKSMKSKPKSMATSTTKESTTKDTSTKKNSKAVIVVDSDSSDVFEVSEKSTRSKASVLSSRIKKTRSKGKKRFTVSDEHDDDNTSDDFEDPTPKKKKQKKSPATSLKKKGRTSDTPIKVTKNLFDFDDDGDGNSGDGLFLKSPPNPWQKKSGNAIIDNDDDSDF